MQDGASCRYNNVQGQPEPSDDASRSVYILPCPSKRNGIFGPTNTTTSIESSTLFWHKQEQIISGGASIVRL
jgi:hypothetical protein